MDTSRDIFQDNSLPESTQQLLCHNCAVIKTVDEFYPHHTGKQGCRQPCIDCYNGFARIRYQHRMAKRKWVASAICHPSPIQKCIEGFSICGHCSTLKLQCDFVADKSRKAGMRPICKACSNKINTPKKSIQRAKDPEKARSHTRQWYRKWRATQTVKRCINRIRTDQAGRQFLVCNHCHADKPIEEYHIHKYSKRGRSQPCKPCRALLMRQCYANASPESYTKRQIRGHNRRARLRGLPATFTAQDHAFMLQYWGYACVTCGNQEGLFGHTLASDHWIPLNSPDCPGTVPCNMVPLCDGTLGCNTGKNDTDPHLWLIKKFGKRKAVIIEKKIAAYFDVVRKRSQQDMAS